VKIAVCVKQVPDATVHKRLDPATNRLDRSGEGALNATDVNAVEEALRLKEASGGEVVVLSLGLAGAYYQYLWSPKNDQLTQLQARVDTLVAQNEIAQRSVAQGTAAKLKAEADQAEQPPAVPAP